MAKTYKVLLCLEMSYVYLRDLMKGIMKYASLKNNWEYVRITQIYPDFVPILKKWGPDGVICTRRGIKHLNEIVNIKEKPSVIADHQEFFTNSCNIISEDNLIGRIIAKYFIDRGYKQFAFYGFKNMLFSQRRSQGFIEFCAKAGFETHLYETEFVDVDYPACQENLGLAEWLKNLPKPIGIMTDYDVHGRQLIEVCRSSDIYVPEQISIVSVDNDEVFCCLSSNIMLSSLSLDFTKAGFEAAEYLDKRMSGEKIECHNIKIHPLGIVTRQSSDSQAIKDKDVASAMAFINRNCEKIISVDDVVANALVSRRKLETKFHQTLSCSIGNKIKVVRVECISNLLLNSNLSITEIAIKFGYSNNAHLARYFKKIVGLTPLKYRRNGGKLN